MAPSQAILHTFYPIEEARPKNFYSCIDSGSLLEVPQPLQHLAIAKAAGEGAVVFYTAEDPITLASQGVLKGLLDRMEVDGFIFFTVQQFNRGKEFDWPFLDELLSRGEVRFAREGITIEAGENGASSPMLYLEIL